MNVETPKEAEGSAEGKPLRTASGLEICLLGISVVIGGQLFSWNIGLAMGFWQCFATFAVISSGYVTLSLCMAEMSSMLPFPGGAYGFNRVTFGSFFGYLIGYSESFGYMLYVCAALEPLSAIMTDIMGLTRDYDPLVWVIFFAVSVGIQVAGGRTFWSISSWLAVISVVLILIFILGVSPSSNFDTYVVHHNINNHETLKSELELFLKYLPTAAWFYVGIECLPLTCGDAIEPKKAVPFGIMSCNALLFTTGLSILFTTCSFGPSIEDLSEALFPLDYGYNHLFSSNQLAHAFVLPATFATAFGFVFAFGRQTRSLAASGLAPAWISLCYGTHRSPYAALLLCTALAFLVLVITKYAYPIIALHLFNLCILGTCITNISLCLSYIVFQYKFSNLRRNFVSPLGCTGAVWGAIVWGTALIGVSFFADDNYMALIVFSLYVICVCIYYHFSASHTQFFSDEEQEILLVAYVIKSNSKHAEHKTKKEMEAKQESVRRRAADAARARKELKAAKAAAAAKEDADYEMELGLMNTKVATDVKNFSVGSFEESKATSMMASIGKVVRNASQVLPTEYQIDEDGNMKEDPMVTKSIRLCKEKSLKFDPLAVAVSGKGMHDQMSENGIPDPMTEHKSDPKLSDRNSDSRIAGSQRMIDEGEILTSVSVHDPMITKVVAFCRLPENMANFDDETSVHAMCSSIKMSLSVKGKGACPLNIEELI